MSRYFEVRLNSSFPNGMKFCVLDNTGDSVVEALIGLVLAVDKEPYGHVFNRPTVLSFNSVDSETGLRTMAEPDEKFPSQFGSRREVMVWIHRLIDNRVGEKQM